MQADNHWAGLGLSLLTAVMWGLLPVSLVVLVDSMDVITITWYRFVTAALVVFLFLRRRGRLPRPGSYDGRMKGLLVLAAMALTGNFLLYLSSLTYLNPESAQVLIQLAPFILLFGSIFIFKEKFGLTEWLGVLLLITGFALFFNDRLSDIFTSLNDYSIGILLMVLASVSWGTYGLIQKTLVRRMASVELTLLMYAGGAALLTAFAQPLQIRDLDGFQWLMLLFCCANLVLAYGAFTEALHRWDAAKVSAVITLAPLVTIATMSLLVRFRPDMFTDAGLNLLSLFGAVLVVTGSVLAALGHRFRSRRQTTDFYHPE